jgi:hypothetical protein
VFLKAFAPQLVSLSIVILLVHGDARKAKVASDAFSGLWGCRPTRHADADCQLKNALPKDRQRSYEYGTALCLVKQNRQ